MDQQIVREWESALDTAELSPITARLPVEFEPGDRHQESATDGTVRKWIAVKIVSGNTGGRWAYWVTHVQNPREDFRAIADKIFNGDAAHFVGMLGTPYVRVPGVESKAWVLVEPRATAPVREWVREEKVGERYERSKDVYDVDTGKTTRLP